MALRAKFTVMAVTAHAIGTGAGEYVKGSEEVVLRPVYSGDPNDENHAFWKATPSGEIRMHISNPGAMGVLQLGHTYYIDFKHVEQS